MDKKIKIVIVDDESELVFPMADRLEMRGFDVQAADSSTSALMLFEKDRFDIALIDVKMPGISGIDLMKMIFRLQPDIKVILMSGHGTEELVRDCKKMGACDLLIKPVKMRDLIERIHGIISPEDE